MILSREILSERRTLNFSSTAIKIELTYTINIPRTIFFSITFETRHHVVILSGAIQTISVQKNASKRRMELLIVAVVFGTSRRSSSYANGSIYTGIKLTPSVTCENRWTRDTNSLARKKNSVSIKDEKKINQVSVLLIPCNPTQQKKTVSTQ